MGRGLIEYPRTPDVYGVDGCNMGYSEVGEGVDFAAFSILYNVLSYLMGKLCLFVTYCYQSLG